jgi:hypothetical protein
MPNFFFLFLLAIFSSDAAFALDKHQVRDWVISHSRSRPLPTIAPVYSDVAKNLVDEFKFDSLAAMEKAGLQRASLPLNPWSGPYWPTYAGQLANRYGDPEYQVGSSWQKNTAYLRRMIGIGAMEELSPAEKYDLLVGDKEFTLTRSMIEAGAPHANASGDVPTWFGLCHGWAPAAFMVSRPQKMITAVSVEGKEISFTPSDIKALATLLWANGMQATRFIGGRCEKEKAERGDPDCFDTNPATWHLAVVNQIAVSKRSFVMDATATQEVWNQPIISYRYHYINPKNGRRSSTLAGAKIALSEYREDKFAHRRDRAAFSVVNIEMEVVYGAETGPSLLPTDSPEQDSQSSVTYSYDLELDREDKIVGGEWHSEQHPDFLWVPEKDSEASSPGDKILDRYRDFRRWSGKSPLWGEWQAAAKKSSASELPLARIVTRLVEMSRE